MERRDYLLRQIQEFTQVVLKLTGLIDDGQFSNGIDVVDDFFSSQVDINISEFESLDEDCVIDFLIKIKGYGINEIELLADILHKFAICLESTQKKNQASHNFKICRTLLIFVDKSSNTFSMERMDKINELDRKIENG